MDMQEIEKLTNDAKHLHLLYVEDDLIARESTLETLGIFFENISSPGVVKTI